MSALTARFAADARAAGADVHQRELCGGHDIVQWRDGFVAGLVNLLGGAPAR